MLRILVLSNLYPPDVIGGYELLCRQAVDSLRERGHEVVVLTSTPGLAVPHESHVRRRLQIADTFADLRQYHALAPLLQKQHQVAACFVNAHNVHALLEALAEEDPEIVYLFNLHGVGGLGLVATLSHVGMPWLWHLADDVPKRLCAGRGPVIPAAVNGYNRLLRGAYLACSESLVDEIEACGLRLRDEVEILPFWIVGDRPPPRPPRDPAAPLRIVTAGQIVRHKGVDLLIEAAALLRRRTDAPFEIDVYGRVLDPTYRALIERHGLGDRVRLRGYRPHAELLPALGGYDVFAFPTHAREPFGVAPIEAAALGCVPLISSVCGIAEWLVDGVHCLKAERTPEAFAEVLAAVLAGRIALAPLAARASAVVWRDFHLGAIVPRIESALARAAGRRSPPVGSAQEAYAMALLADQLSQALLSDAFSG